MAIALILTADGLGHAWWSYGLAYIGDFLLVSLWVAHR